MADDTTTADSSLRFADFSLDLRRRGLYREGQRLHLTAKPLEVLMLLARNAGRTVEKREILDAVWSGTFVTEDVLVQAIREIRRALGDDKEDPVFVQTVPRQGYRFVARLTPEPETTTAVKEAAVPPSVDRSQARLGPWGPSSRAAVLALAGGILLLLAAVFSRRGQEPAGAGPGPAIGAPIRQLSFGIGTAVKPAYSPDGKTLLFVSSADPSFDVQDLYLMPAEGGNAWRITDRFDVRGDLPVFTHDGSRIVFGRFRSGEGGSREPDLWVVPSFGGTPRLFLAGASGAGFSPDGSEVAYTKHQDGRSPLWSSPAADLGVHREIAERGFVPRFSPDGRWLAYTTSNPEGGAGELWVVARDGNRRRRLTSQTEQHYGLAWTRDSSALVFASNGGGTFHLRRASLLGGRAVPLTAGLGEYSSPTVAGNGSSIAFSHVRPTRDLRLAARAEEPAVEALTRGDYHYQPRLSPTARRAASVMRQPDLAEHVFVMDLASRRRDIVSERPARDPCWLDDDRLAYLTDGAGQTEVWLADTRDGSSRRLTAFAGRADWLAVASDLARVAVVERASGGRRILVRDLAGGTDAVVAAGGEYEALRFSPDGRRLAWSGPPVSAGPSSNGVWVHDLGTAPRRIVDDGYAPVWSADGAGLYFSRYGRAGEGLWLLRPRDRSPTRRRAWKLVKHYDLAAGRLLFVEDGRSPSGVYSMALAP